MTWIISLCCLNSDKYKNLSKVETRIFKLLGPFVTTLTVKTGPKVDFPIEVA